MRHRRRNRRNTAGRRRTACGPQFDRTARFDVGDLAKALNELGFRDTWFDGSRGDWTMEKGEVTVEYMTADPVYGEPRWRVMSPGRSIELTEAQEVYDYVQKQMDKHAARRPRYAREGHAPEAYIDDPQLLMDDLVDHYEKHGGSMGMFEILDLGGSGRRQVLEVTATDRHGPTLVWELNDGSLIAEIVHDDGGTTELDRVHVDDEILFENLAHGTDNDYLRMVGLM